MSSTVRVLRPIGILDSINGEQLRQKVNDLIEAGDRAILIDCKEVTFMDSAGLAALVIALKKIREVNGQLSLCALNEQLTMLLELTDMDGLFEILPGAAEFYQTV